MIFRLNLRQRARIPSVGKIKRVLAVVRSLGKDLSSIRGDQESNNSFRSEWILITGHSPAKPFRAYIQTPDEIAPRIWGEVGQSSINECDREFQQLRPFVEVSSTVPVCRVDHPDYVRNRDYAQRSRARSHPYGRERTRPQSSLRLFLAHLRQDNHQSCHTQIVVKGALVGKHARMGKRDSESRNPQGCDRKKHLVLR
jgi:hypothetical protein